MRVLIAGAGIGGLTAALAIRQAGHDVTVFERAPAIAEVGAGISLWINAVRALDQIGIGAAIRSLGAPALNGTLRTKHGQQISRTDYATALGLTDGASYVVHRADLLDLLLADLPAAALRLGATVRGFSQDGNQVTVRFEDGSTETGDLLIGADGIRSRVRQQLFGGPAPRYSGFTAWRGVCQRPPSVSEAFEAWGRGDLFGVTLMSRDRVYWYAGAVGPPDRSVPSDVARFRGWLPPVDDLLDATPAALVSDVYDLPPLTRWHEGRVALLGDAAHAMTPNLGQGGCQAIEDAVVLGQCLANGPDGLVRYGAIRRPRAQQVAAASRQMGLIALASNPVAQWLRDRLLPRVPTSVAMRQIAPLIDYDVATARPN